MTHPTIKRLEETFEKHLESLFPPSADLFMPDGDSRGMKERLRDCLREAFLSGAKAMQEAMKGEEIVLSEDAQEITTEFMSAEGYNHALASQREAGMKFIKSLEVKK